MTLIDSLKKYYGISDMVLALYLELSPETVYSIRKGRRSWPFSALLKATVLQQVLQLKVPIEELEGANDLIKAERQENFPKLDQHIKSKEAILAKRIDELSQLMDKRAQYLRGIQACEAVLNQNQDNQNRKWLELRQKDLELKLKDNSIAQVWKLEAGIRGLKEELVELRKK